MRRAAVIILGLVASAGLILCAAAMVAGLAIIGAAIAVQDMLDA